MTGVRRIAPGIAVLISSAWGTTCTVVDGRDGVLLVDGPVLPDDHSALISAVAGRPATALVTHADWDHLRAAVAMPGARLVAGALTARRMRAEADGLRAEADAEYRRRGLPPPAVWDPPDCAVARVPGRVVTPAGRVRTVPCAGHTPDGTAYLLEERGLLWPGDHLSPVEIPSIAPGGLADYLATLDRLEPLLTRETIVIPGHGRPLGASAALRILAEDRRYLEALAGGGDPVPPRDGGDPAGTAHMHRLNRAAARDDAGG